MKYIKRITDIILYISLSVCMLGAILFVLPKMFGYGLYAQTERSFDGRVEKGSLIYFEKCDPAGIDIGDVAIFESENEADVDSITYIDYETNCIEAMSVAECEPQSFRFTALYGKKAASIKGLGYIYSFVSRTDGMTVTIFVLLFILILSIGADTLYLILGKKKKRLKASE